MDAVPEPAPEFRWNAEEAHRLLDRGYRIILTKDGLGDVTALAVPKGESLNGALRDWRNHDGYEAERLACGLPEDVSDAVVRVLMQRSIFNGPDGRTGGGRSVAQALHSLVEKMIFKRLPHGDGTASECPPPPTGENP